MMRYRRVRIAMEGHRRLLWWSVCAILALLAADAVLALAHLEAIEASLPALARQPVTDAVLIAVPLLPALAVRAAEQGLCPPRRAPATGVPRARATSEPWRRSAGMTPPPNDSARI